MECSLRDIHWYAFVFFILSVMLHVYSSGAEMCNIDSCFEWQKASWLMRHRQTNRWQERGAYVSSLKGPWVDWSNHSLIPREPSTHWFLSNLKRSVLLNLIWQPLFNGIAFICGCQASYEGQTWRLAACRLAWPWSVSQGLLAECKIMLPNTVLFTARPTSSPANTPNI